MKRIVIAVMAAVLIFSMAGCKTAKLQEENKSTQPVQTTVLVTEAPGPEQEQTTVDPFDGESEIDFSDFETEPTVTEPAPTEPSETEPQVKPEPTQPAPTQPEPTEPEETDPPATVPPTYEPDGYHSQIVRP